MPKQNSPLKIYKLEEIKGSKMRFYNVAKPADKAELSIEDFKIKREENKNSSPLMKKL